MSQFSDEEEMVTHCVTRGEELEQNEAVNYGQIFVTKEPCKSFLCIRERGRGRTEVQNVNAAVIPVFLSRGMGISKVGAG